MAKKDALDALHARANQSNRDVTVAATTTKPTWIDALEESLLVAVGGFSLIVWVALVAVPN